MDRGRDMERWRGTAGGSIVIITKLLRAVAEMFSSDRVKYALMCRTSKAIWRLMPN